MIDSNYSKFQKDYLKEKRINWPFLRLLELTNTTLNIVFKEIMINFNKYANLKKYSYLEYYNSLDIALGIFYDINYWITDSLNKQNIDNYSSFWFHQDYSIDEYKSISINFPNNIDTLILDINTYIECPFLNSKMLNWSLIDIIIFKELKAQSSSIYLTIAMTKGSFLSRVFNWERKKNIEKLNKLIIKLFNVYLNCKPNIFHPIVIEKLCIDLRKEGDYYDGVLFDLLEYMKSNK